MKNNISVVILLSLLSAGAFADTLKFSEKKSFRVSDYNCMFDKPCDFEEMRERAMAKCERRAIYCSTTLQLSVGKSQSYNDRCGTTTKGMCYVEVEGRRW